MNGGHPRIPPALAILAITALSFFIFPGHTYLEQDTQIYVPILENQWSGALASDLIVQYPHVSFTLYDELTNCIRWVTRLPLQFILEGEQFLFRAAGFLGIYLIAASFQLDSTASIVVTALWALGATIKAPAVLTVEYEPTPRSFAIPLLFLAVGCALNQRFRWAGIAGAAAVLLHAPSTWPFFVVAVIFVFTQSTKRFPLGASALPATRSHRARNPRICRIHARAPKLSRQTRARSGSFAAHARFL